MNKLLDEKLRSHRNESKSVYKSCQSGDDPRVPTLVLFINKWINGITHNERIEDIGQISHSCEIVLSCWYCITAFVLKLEIWDFPPPNNLPKKNNQQIDQWIGYQLLILFKKNKRAEIWWKMFSKYFDMNGSGNFPCFNEEPNSSTYQHQPTCVVVQQIEKDNGITNKIDVKCAYGQTFHWLAFAPELNVFRKIEFK